MRDFHQPGRSAVYSTNGMAATSMPAATLTALDVLRAGGNAVDAAIAACAVLGVIEPQSTGIGGDCFCLYAPAGGDAVFAVNGSGRAPAAASIDYFDAAGITALANTSPHTVTIPGAVSAWQLLLERFGSKDFDELLRPAIRYAEEGFPVHPRVAADWSEEGEKLARSDNELFLPGGRPPAEGARFVQAALAKTLRAVAAKGADAFYLGEVAQDMGSTLQKAGGLHREEDFARGRRVAEFVEPIHAQWKGYDVWQCPPNGSGIVVLMMLGILDALGPTADGPTSTLRLHRHIEAARLAYRDRDAFVADPSQAKVPVAQLTSPDYTRALATLIDDRRALSSLPAPGVSPVPAHRDTVYISVVDRDGNACSFINSLFQSFGSGILAKESGVLLHNRGFGFRLERGHPNCIAPDKRPMHTIMPGMLTREGHAVMPFGVMGGHFQPMGQTLFLTNLLEYGMDIQEALEAPRLFPFAGAVEVERGIPERTRVELAAMGHRIVEIGRPHGGGQAIWIDRERGVLVGGSDPRKDGIALGY
ncbi:gamma-glutamyltransferase [Chelatococcus sp. GCM10030263]|uniref:gamma-glutamyltransferase n=1 Tax=Chelatococcus sp. GCM10030263 TaxID=3273387 RepID=UPI00361DA3A6